MFKSFPVLFLSSVSSILCSSGAVAQVPNIAGDWKMSIIGEDISPTYTLIQTGNLLTVGSRLPVPTVGVSVKAIACCR